MILAMGDVLGELLDRSAEESVARIEAVDLAAARAVGARMVAAARPALALYGPVETALGRDAIAARLAA